MKPGKWIFGWFSITLLVVAVVMTFNYLMDPLWITGETSQFNSIRLGFNERQQKTNYLLAHPNEKHEVLVLGSSRSTYLSTSEFRNHSVFNYAANNMHPSAYIGYLENYVSITGRQPKTVILGLDFWGTNANTTFKSEEPPYYLQTATSWSYLPKICASMDATRYAVKNLKHSITHPPTDDAYYDHQLAKWEYGADQAVREQRIRNQVKVYNESSYGNYSWHTSYTSTLTTLKSSYPNIEFVVFTTPVADTLLSIMYELGRMNDYIYWLESITTIFGEVQHWMVPDDSISNQSLYYDAQHFKPALANRVTNSLLSSSTDNVPILITPTNIDEQTQQLLISFQNQFD